MAATSVWKALESAMGEVKGLDDAMKVRIRNELQTVMLSIPDTCSRDTIIDSATLAGRLYSHHAPHAQPSQTILLKGAVLMLGTPKAPHSPQTLMLTLSSDISLHSVTHKG